VAQADAAVFDAFLQANARKMKGYDAPFACVEAVKAAVDLPFDEGMALEKQLFIKLIMSVQSAALRHIFFSERKAGKIEGLAEDVKPLPVRKVGVIGAGTMGGGIAMNFLSAGIPVTMLEMKQEALDRGVATIRKNYEGNVARGRMKPEQLEAAMGLLTPTLAYDDLGDCDLIIEAVFELMSVKQEVFAKLDAVAKPGAILASNTSFLDLDEIAAATKRPEAVIGLHFFSPANVMKLLEVVRGAKTDPQVLATAMAVAKTIRKVAVVSGVCWGFIGNRILFARQVQADKLVLEGAKPKDVDRVLVDFGMPMGPFQMADLAGIDIGWHRDPTKRENMQDILCAEGRLGQKSGSGYYDYDEKRNGTPSAHVEGLIADFAKEKGIPQRAISDEEILERCLYPMVNEAAKILEEGIAQRASDIDIAWVYGYGWPPYRGGPMFWADMTGPDVILAGLEKHRERLGEGFAISPLLREKAETKKRFTM
jgi:3-hydroxyacyl-CoA dehydrogenase